ncbi:uncharacterized protein A4U43_C04F3230 [Asparagus officinalis]|uniref:Uncharacterized protein n=1 Tax=Asparagus officinalis TaxID=4686 RepID=A0A5P1EXX6_ASPOF|nr:uncharacterized protein A4U43_C04F3230 [Asparagus officinalis]
MAIAKLSNSSKFSLEDPSNNILISDTECEERGRGDGVGGGGREARGPVKHTKAKGGFREINQYHFPALLHRQPPTGRIRPIYSFPPSTSAETLRKSRGKLFRFQPQEGRGRGRGREGKHRAPHPPPTQCERRDRRAREFFRDPKKTISQHSRENFNRTLTKCRGSPATFSTSDLSSALPPLPSLPSALSPTNRSPLPLLPAQLLPPPPPPPLRRPGTPASPSPCNLDLTVACRPRLRRVTPSGPAQSLPSPSPSPPPSSAPPSPPLLPHPIRLQPHRQNPPRDPLGPCRRLSSSDLSAQQLLDGPVPASIASLASCSHLLPLRQQAQRAHSRRHRNLTLLQSLRGRGQPSTSAGPIPGSHLVAARLSVLSLPTPDLRPIPALAGKLRILARTILGFTNRNADRAVPAELGTVLVCCQRSPLRELAFPGP